MKVKMMLCKSCGSYTCNERFSSCAECGNTDVVFTDDEMLDICEVLISKGYNPMCAASRDFQDTNYHTSITFKGIIKDLPCVSDGVWVCVSPFAIYTFDKTYSTNLSPEELQGEIQETISKLFEWANNL